MPSYVQKLNGRKLHFNVESEGTAHQSSRISSSADAFAKWGLASEWIGICSRFKNKNIGVEELRYVSHWSYASVNSTTNNI